MNNKQLGHNIKCVKGNESFYSPTTYFCTECKIKFIVYLNADNGYYSVKPIYDYLTCDEVKIAKILNE